MLVTIEMIDGFYIVKYFGKEISRKKSMTQATKALAKFAKGRE